MVFLIGYVSQIKIAYFDEIVVNFPVKTRVEARRLIGRKIVLFNKGRKKFYGKITGTFGESVGEVKANFGLTPPDFQLGMEAQILPEPETRTCKYCGSKFVPPELTKSKRHPGRKIFETRDYCSKECHKKHIAEIVNAERNIKYHTDLRYRKKILENNKKYRDKK